ncbi:hypothetical protein EMPS_08147 [Entomortierella parvispora]|uniref:Transmembrane protein n=1 Tax=Entomortierella parvispora TaxID=205924 RepID=A0A9P3LZ16_9FUNG|nr:hypothetical protein EMPS_08147 [Entomortierella parvispora]
MQFHVMDESFQTEAGRPHDSRMKNTADGDHLLRRHQQQTLSSTHIAPPNTPAESSSQQTSRRKWRHSGYATSTSRRSSTSTLHGIHNLRSLDEEAEKEEAEEEEDGSTRTSTDPAFARICSLLTHLLTDASIAVGGPDAEETLGSQSSLVLLDNDETEGSETMSDMDQDDLVVKEVRNIKNNSTDSATQSALPRLSNEAEEGEGSKKRGLYKDNLGRGGAERHFERWSWAASTHAGNLGSSRRRRSWSSRMVKGQSLFLELQQSIQANEPPPSNDEATVHDIWNHSGNSNVWEDGAPTMDSRYQHQMESAPALDPNSSWTSQRVPLKTPRRCASFPPNPKTERLQKQEQQQQHTEELQRVIERVESELNHTVETIDGLTKDLVAVATHQQWVHMNLQQNYFRRLARHHNSASMPANPLLRQSFYYDSHSGSLARTAVVPRWTIGDAQARERARSMDSWAEPACFALSSYFLDEDYNGTNDRNDDSMPSTLQGQGATEAMNILGSMFLDNDSGTPQDHHQQPSPGFFSGVERHEGCEDAMSLKRQSNRFSKSSSACTLVDESMSHSTHPLAFPTNSSCRDYASSNISTESKTEQPQVYHGKSEMEGDTGPRRTLCSLDADQGWNSEEATSTNPEDFWVFLSSLIMYLSQAPVSTETPIPVRSSTPLSGMPTWTTTLADFTTVSWSEDQKLLCTDLTPPKTNKLLRETTTTTPTPTAVMAIRDDPEHQEKRRLLMARAAMITTFQLFSLLFWTLMFSIATMLLAPPLTRVARRRILYTMDHIIVELTNMETKDDTQENTALYK